MATLLSFFFIMLVLIMTPMSYLENMIADHVVKSSTFMKDSNSGGVLQSRDQVWKQSIKQAEKGGIMGGGFSATIGDNDFSGTYLSNGSYGREKGNSQLAIMEETGIIGLILYAIILIYFFTHAIPYYLRLRGFDRVAMGSVLGAIVGLLMESIVEGWWDSAAGPELVCFWTFVGVAYGMIYLEKRKLRIT